MRSIHSFWFVTVFSYDLHEYNLVFDLDEGQHEFLSGSHDQTILIWKYDQNRNRVQSLKTCKGHQGTVETLALQKTCFASGSFDKTIKLWGLGRIK